MRKLALVLVTILLAAACTSEAPSSDPDPSVPSETSTENPLGECARQTSIGLVPSADSAEQALGAQMAIDLLNERESFFYELERSDEDPDDAVEGFITGDVSAVIGSVPRTLAERLEAGRVPTVGLSEVDVIDTVGSAIVRIAATDIETVAEAVDGLVQLLGLKKVALLVSKGVPPGFAGRSFGDIAISTADAAGAVALDPDAVAVVALPQRAQRTVDSLAEEGFEGAVVLGPAAVDADTSALRGDVYVARPWAPESPLKLSEDFVATFEAERGRAPDLGAALAYSAVLLIARAVEEACSNERADVIAELPEANRATTLLGRFSFDREGAPSHPVVVFELEGEDLKPVGLTPGD